MSEQERFIREQIAALNKEYFERIEPWVKQLVQIEAMKPPKPIWVDPKQFPGVDIDAAHRSKE